MLTDADGVKGSLITNMVDVSGAVRNARWDLWVEDPPLFYHIS